MAIEIVTKYRTDDGVVHDTPELAQAHELELAKRAWLVGFEHWLSRQVKLRTVISDGDVTRLALMLYTEADEVIRLLSDRPT